MNMSCAECASFEAALVLNHTDCIDRLYLSGLKPTEEEMKLVAANKSDAMLRHFHNIGGLLSVHVTNAALQHAIKTREVDCLRYLLCVKSPTMPIFYDFIITEAKEYTVDLLTLLVAHKVPSLTIYTSSLAAELGNLEALKYLHSIGCPWDKRTLIVSKMKNQEACLQYAKDNKCPDKDMRFDVEDDLKALQKFFLEITTNEHYYSKLYTRRKRSLEGTCRKCKTVFDAAFLGHMDCFESLPPSTSQREVMKMALLGGHLSMIQYLNTLNYEWHPYTTSYACALDNPDILKFAIEQGCPWDNPFTMGMAVLSRSQRCLQFAITNGCPFYNLTYNVAAAEGVLSMMYYLYSQHLPCLTVQCLCRATKAGHAEVARFILDARGCCGAGCLCAKTAKKDLFKDYLFDKAVYEDSTKLATAAPLSKADLTLEDRLKAEVLRFPKEWYDDAMSKLKTCTDSSNKDKAQAYVERMLKIPFGKYHSLPVSRGSATRDELNNYFNESQSALDEAVYAMDQVKEEVMNFIAQLVSTNNEGKPRVIGLCGSPGIGKTAIVRRGLATALGRKIATINMGGISDADHFLGHSYTYVGSQPGIIVRSLMDLGSMNGIIFMDEVDKVSSKSGSNEIQSLLMHLTDPLQSSTFNDKYFAGLNLDLSQIIFVFSYNDSSKIDPILRDRIYEIKVPDPSLDEKVVIGTKYLLKEIVGSVGMTADDVVFTPEIVRYMLKHWCASQAGVRRLKNCMQTLLLKLNTAQYMSKPKYKSLSGGVSFPFKVTQDVADDLLSDMKPEVDKFINMMYA